MTSEAAQRAKNNGAEAWKSGDFQQAVHYFSEAITAAASSDKEFLKLMHSNRSAAYLKLNRASEALTDGEKCVSLDANWAKGYTRKGDALFALRRFTDAYNAYNAGLRVQANDATLVEKAEQAMRAIRNDAASSSSSSTSSTAGTGAGLIPAAQLRLVKIAILVLGVVYLVPFLGSINGLAFRASAALFALVHMSELLARHGMPKFTTEYAMRVFPDAAMMKVVLGTFLMLSIRPYFFALVPALLVVIAGFTGEIFTYMRNNSDQIEGTMLPLLQRFAPQMQMPSLRQILNPAMQPQISEAILRMAASCEVSQGIFFLVELLLPTRNVMQMFLWWQYLRMRYMMDKTGHVKAAFRDMDAKITQLLNYQFVPAIVRTVYGKIKGYMASQVETPSASSASQPSSGLGSMMSKCSVM